MRPPAGKWFMSAAAITAVGVGMYTNDPRYFAALTLPNFGGGEPPTSGGGPGAEVGTLDILEFVAASLILSAFTYIFWPRERTLDASA